MSEDNFEQMLNETFKPIHTGEIVEGEVIDVKPDRNHSQHPWEV